MKRRDFIKLAALTGLSLSAPFAFNPAKAATQSYEGPFWIMINADGGWDPTLLCDPKGRISENQAEPINHYFTDDIRQTGAIRYAPRGNNQTFFEKYGSDLLVINGIDTATNNHEVGLRYSWSGRLAPGYPTLPALIAAAHAPELPLSFITNGGYDATRGVVPPARIDTQSLSELANPNHFGNEAENTYHSTSTLQRITEAREARHQALLQKQKLPRMRRAINQLHLVQSRTGELKRLFDYYTVRGEDETENPLLTQGRLAIAAYKAGLAVSVNINHEGDGTNFDTHENHDTDHEPLLEELLEGIDLIMQEAERQNVADQVVLVIGSDFGRTPFYNEEGGKDHWPIGSMMFMGKGIRGNRVIGATDDNQKALKVNSQTLQLADNGILITPIHVHQALRKLAGIENSTVAQRFAFGVEDLALF